MNILTALVIFVVGCVCLLALFVAYLRLTAPKRAPMFLTDEHVFVDEHDNVHAFPAFDANKPTLYASVIVPAYEEERRISKMLDEAFEYLLSRQKRDASFTFEIVVVSDGSKDKTAQIVQHNYVRKHGANLIRVLDLRANRGKGGAVRRGFFSARGRLLFMADADGASKLSECFEKLERAYLALPTSRDDYGIAIGSRAHLETDDAVNERPLLRKFLAFGFHMLVVVVGGISTLRDTQCGYKLFGRRTVEQIFRYSHIERWAFDLELLYLSLRYFKTDVVEVSIDWREIDGSKMNLAQASLQMAIDMARIRFYYTTGVWSVSR